MKRGYLSTLLRFSLIAGASVTGTAQAGVYSYLGTADAPGMVVTHQGVLLSAANQLTNIIENRLKKTQGSIVILPEKKKAGVSAGDPLTGFAIWGNAEYDHIRNSLSSTDYSGHITYISGGMDTSLGEDSVIGLAVTWESDNFDTVFNAGQQDASGWALIPYFAMMLDNCWSFAILGGYEWIDYDIERTEIATLSHLTGSVRGGRYFAAGELTYQHLYNCAWDVGAQVAVLYLREHNRGFYEYSTRYTVFNSAQDYHLGRFKIGGSLGYISGALEPYVRAAFLWDFDQSDVVVSPIQPFPSNSDTAGLFGVGVNLLSTDNVLFNVDLYTEQFRDDFNHWGAMVNFRVTL